MARKYEAVYILDPAMGDDANQTVMDRIQALVESSATLERVDVWGKRRMSYPIKDQNEGLYVQIDFSSEAEFPKELERVLKITDGVLRYLVLRMED